MKDVMGIISLNENEKNILELTRNRPIATIPYAGRYRVIDFQLSNMVNSGISNIGVFASHKPRSVVEHLGVGRPWDLDRKRDGLFIFYPSLNLVGGLYSNDLNNLKENIEYLENSKQKYVVIAPSYMILNFNYKDAIKFHKKSQCDVTLIYKTLEQGEEGFQYCDTLEMDSHGGVTSFGKRIEKEKCNISTEIFIMKREFLLHIIYKTRGTSEKVKLKDLISYMSSEFIIKAYEFKGRLQCIDSIDSYFRSNMELLKKEVSKEIFEESNPIYTKTNDNPPVRYGKESVVKNSLVANGAIIEGTVENSIVFRGVKVERGAVVRNSILMSKCSISENTLMEYTIVDKNSVVFSSKEILGDEKEIVVIKKNSII